MTEDARLKQAVLSELSWDPSVTAAHIGVTAKNGVVTLMGHVDNYAEKHAAEVAASRVKGVKAVAEEIEVKLPYDPKHSDDDIAAAAVGRLAWDVSVPPDAIRIKVENGWVTLTGQVEWYHQKSAVAQEIRWLSSVAGVSDQITIKPRPDTTKISDNIMAALHRSWLYDAKTVSVSAEGGRIRLEGTVRSLHERQVANTTAWAAAGATAVENNLVVV